MPLLQAYRVTSSCSPGPWNRFRGGWRIAAMVPLMGAVPTVLWSLYALSQNSNLWPLTFIFFAPAGALYLVVLALLRHFAGAAA